MGSSSPARRKTPATGFITEIANLVPACGKCNQSKGNKPWRDWMLSGAKLSPTGRAVANVADRVSAGSLRTMAISIEGRLRIDSSGGKPGITTGRSAKPSIDELVEISRSPTRYVLALLMNCRACNESAGRSPLRRRMRTTTPRMRGGTNGI